MKIDPFYKKGKCDAQGVFRDFELPGIKPLPATQFFTDEALSANGINLWLPNGKSQGYLFIYPTLGHELDIPAFLGSSTHKRKLEKYGTSEQIYRFALPDKWLKKNSPIQPKLLIRPIDCCQTSIAILSGRMDSDRSVVSFIHKIPPKEREKVFFACQAILSPLKFDELPQEQRFNKSFEILGMFIGPSRSWLLWKNLSDKASSVHWQPYQKVPKGPGTPSALIVKSEIQLLNAALHEISNTVTQTLYSKKTMDLLNL